MQERERMTPYMTGPKIDKGSTRGHCGRVLHPYTAGSIVECQLVHGINA